MNGYRRLHRPARGVPRRLRWRDAVARSRPGRDPCRASRDPPGSSCRRVRGDCSPCFPTPRPVPDGALTAAAIVVAVVVGGALIIGNQNPQGDVGAPAAPTPTPTAGPDARRRRPRPSTLGSSAPMAPCSISATGAPACIKPGTYTLSSPADWPSHDQLRRARGLVGLVAPASSFDGVLVDARASSARGRLGLGRHVHDGRRRLPRPVRSDGPDVRVTAMSTRPRSSLPRWRRGPGSMRRPPCRSRSMAPTGVLVELTSTKTPQAVPGREASSGRPGGGTLVDPYPTVGADGQRRPGQFRILDVGGKLLVIRTTDFPDPSPFEVDQGCGARPDPSMRPTRSRCTPSSTRSSWAIRSRRPAHRRGAAPSGAGRRSTPSSSLSSLGPFVNGGRDRRHSADACSVVEDFGSPRDRPLVRAAWRGGVRGSPRCVSDAACCSPACSSSRSAR